MSRGYRAGPLILDPKFGVDSEHSVRSLKDWLLEALGGLAGPVPHEDSPISGRAVNRFSAT